MRKQNGFLMANFAFLPSMTFFNQNMPKRQILRKQCVNKLFQSGVFCEFL